MSQFIMPIDKRRKRVKYRDSRRTQRSDEYDMIGQLTLVYLSQEWSGAQVGVSARISWRSFLSGISAQGFDFLTILA